MKKKVLKNALIAIGWIGALLFALGITSIIVLVVLSATNGFDSVNCWWMVLYYSFAVIGAIGTFLAVYVALNKEQLTRLLYSPEFHFDKATGNPQPIYSKNNQIIEKYSQYLTISNKSDAEAVDCVIEVVQVLCDKNHKQKFKVIPILGQNPVKLNREQDGLISKQAPIDFLLFEVNNPNADTQPEVTASSPASIQFSGFSIDSSYLSMGRYRIEYRLRCKDGYTTHFKVEVDWIGEWTEDKNEMLEKFETKIIK